MAKNLVLSKCLCCGKNMTHSRNITAPLYCLACDYEEAQDVKKRIKDIENNYKRPGKRQKTQRTLIAKYGKKII
jgi:hypothetical protein